MSETIGGGVDQVFETRRPGFEPRLLLEACLDVWPEAMAQQAEAASAEPVRELLTDPRIATWLEWFVYKDGASAESWANEGWTARYGNDMAHFLADEDPARPDILQLTVVLDYMTAETHRLVSAAFDALEHMTSGGQSPRERSRRIDWEADLQAVGYSGGRDQFYDKVEGLRVALYPDWTADELACHPHEALQFCEVVRHRVAAPVPDHLVMKALMNRRRERKRDETAFQPRLLRQA